MKGKDVEDWQEILNKQFDRWAVEYGLVVDGKYGHATRAAAATVLYGMGIKRIEMADGVTPGLRIKVRDQNLTPTERVRRVSRRLWRQQLRKKHAGGGFASPIAKILTSSHGFKPGHDGVDLICLEDAPVFALCKAEVIDVRAGSWWGDEPKDPVAHPKAEGDGIIQLKCLTDVGPFTKGMHFGYGHAEKSTVKVGQIVKAGQQVGHAGFANAPHLHFMANSGANKQGRGDRDPMPYVRYAQKHA